MVKGGLKLEINIPPQHILAKSKGGIIIEGGVSSSEYGKIICSVHNNPQSLRCTADNYDCDNLATTCISRQQRHIDLLLKPMYRLCLSVQ